MPGSPDTTLNTEDDGEMLPDERAAIKMRGDLLDEFEDDDLLTIDEVADGIGIDLN